VQHKFSDDDEKTPEKLKTRCKKRHQWYQWCSINSHAILF